jgi:hypothetical protein
MNTYFYFLNVAFSTLSIIDENSLQITMEEN